MNHCLKQGHPLVVLINLRQDLVVECNGETYGIRELDDLERPIIINGVSGTKLEVGTLNGAILAINLAIK